MLSANKIRACFFALILICQACKSTPEKSPYSFKQPPQPWLFDVSQSGASWQSYNYIHSVNGRRLLLVVNECGDGLNCLQQYLHYHCVRPSNQAGVKAACVTKEPAGVVLWHQNSILNINSLQGAKYLVTEKDTRSLITFLNDNRYLNQAEAYLASSAIIGINARIKVFQGKKHVCAPTRENKFNQVCYASFDNVLNAQRYMSSFLKNQYSFSQEKLRNLTFDVASRPYEAVIRSKNQVFIFETNGTIPVKQFYLSELKNIFAE